MAFSLRIQSVVGKRIVDTEAILRVVADVQNQYARDIVARGQNYPAERPNQKYVRTYKLRSAWRIIPSRRSGDRQVVDITNNATDKRPGRTYAGYVFGTDDKGSGQSAYHVGRWPTKGQLADRETYRQQVQAAIAEGVR